MFDFKTMLKSPSFLNLEKFFLVLLPHTSVERIFSILKNCKTDRHIKLKTEILLASTVLWRGSKQKNDAYTFDWQRPWQVAACGSNVCKHKFRLELSVVILATIVSICIEQCSYFLQHMDVKQFILH